MSHQCLLTVSTKYTALYAARPPTKPMFSLEESIAQHFEVLDEPLTNDEIRAAAKRMKNRHFKSKLCRELTSKRGATKRAAFQAKEQCRSPVGLNTRGWH